MRNERNSPPYDEDSNRPSTTSGPFAAEWRESSEAILESIAEDEDTEMEDFSSSRVSEKANPDAIQSIRMILGVPAQKAWGAESPRYGSFDNDGECCGVNLQVESCMRDGVSLDAMSDKCERSAVDEEQTMTRDDLRNGALTASERVNKDAEIANLADSEVLESFPPSQGKDEYPSLVIAENEIQDNNIKKEKDEEEVEAHRGVKNNIIIAQEEEQASVGHSRQENVHPSEDKLEEFKPTGVLSVNEIKVEESPESSSPLLSSVDAAAQQSLRRLQKILLSAFPSKFRTMDCSIGKEEEKEVMGKGESKSDATKRRAAATRRRKERPPSVESLMHLLHGLCQYGTFIHGSWMRYHDEVLTQQTRNTNIHNGSSNPNPGGARKKRRASSGIVGFGRRRRTRRMESPPHDVKHENEEITLAGESRQAAATPPCGFSFKRWSSPKANTLARETKTTLGVDEENMDKAYLLLNGKDIPLEAFMSREEHEKYARYAMSSGKLRHECLEPFQFLFSRSQKIRHDLQELLNSLEKGQGVG